MNSDQPARFQRVLAPIVGMSLKARLVLMTVGLFVVFIWALAFLSVTLLQGHFEELLAEQQLANARRVASQVDARLKDNIEGLTGAAASLPGELSYELLQPQLSQLPFLHIAFSGGIAVIGLDGVAIADYPVAPGRRGAYYGDRDYFLRVVESGKPYIDKPIIGRALKRPVLTTAVPVFAPDGRLRAVMTGITDLTATNFLGFVADRAQVGAGEYFVMSLRDRIIIAASDSKRNMQPSPAPGRNLFYDRLAAGFEGSGVAASSEGIKKLYSGVRVPTADWLILAALPAEIAFGPLRTLRTYLFVMAGLLTLAAALLIRLMLRRLLAPLKAAGVAMQQMTAGQIPLAPLPIVYQDEIGRLVGNFNQLIVDRQQYEAALADSEQRFRLLVEQAPDGIYVQTGGRFSYANSAALTLFGAQDASELLGRSVVSQVRADYQSAVAERIRRMNEQRECLPTVEQVYLKLDGTPIDVEISAVPFRYCDADGSLVFVRDITARKQADEAVRRSEARFHSLFDHMLEGFAYCRMIFEQGTAVDFVYLDVNPAFGRLTGLVDIIGKKVSSLSPTFRDDNAELLAAYGRVAAGGPPEKFETYVVGLKQWFLISAYQADDDCFVAVFDVITRQKQAEENQLRLNRALRLLSDCNTALVHAEHEQGLLEQICQLVVEHGGYQMAWVGYAEDDAARTVRPVAQAGSAAACLETGKISWGGPTADLCPTGRAIATGQPQVNHGIGTGDTGAGSGAAVTPWCEAAAACGFRSSIGLPLLSNKRVFGALAIYSAVADAFLADEVALLQELAGDLAYGIETLRARSQRAIAEARLDFLAHHDALTGLPNRLLLHDRFDRAVAQAERDGSKLAMLFLDLDNFKQINDSLGHGVGDQLLVALAERLRDCIRDSDTISRQGGDEFIILMGGQRDVRMVAQVAQVAQKILETIAEPFEIAGNVLSTSFSVGISVYPDDARDFDLLLKNADAALYHAKDSGRNAYSFFASGMNVDALARMQLQSGLRNALKNQEFLLHYQPQLDIVSGRIIGVEALLRWQPADGPLVPPGSFIPVAEQSGLIIAIGEWVLHEACRQAAAWQAAGMPQLVVAVNLSALQFRRGSILDTVAAALASSGLPAHCLELELTESILLQDVDSAMKTLHSLKELGVQLSIDDFGTGYSSLSYLKRLAVDKLKIDQSFVRDIAEDPDDAAIVRAIVQLGHTMQLKVIAEGVETDRQLAFLCQYGCDQVQGYLFSRPLPAAALEPLLRDGLPGAQPAGSSASEIPSAFATPLP